MTLLASIKEFVRAQTGPLFWGATSYAQEGEDLVLRRLFDHGRTGFYVDVGCHHPFRFSNTYLFYKLGWRGICVDPLPGAAALFRRWRPRDVALEIGVSTEPTTLTYHMFNEPALNTFDPALATARDGVRHYRIIDRKPVPVVPLASILHDHLEAPETRIDFLSVDVEGLDLDVLRSNDWKRFRPRAVVVESLGSDLMSLARDPIVDFMDSVGYLAFAKTGQSVVFVERTMGDDHGRPASK